MEGNSLDETAPQRGGHHQDSQGYEASAESIHRSIVLQGNESQISVGGITIQSTRHGPVLVNLPREVSVRRRRSAPDLRQRRTTIVDRDAERSSIQVTQPGMVEIVGEVGVGKSSLLGALSYELTAEDSGRFGDGYAYIPAGAR